MNNLKIEKNIPVQRRKTSMFPLDPEAYEIAKQMEVGDSVLVGDKKRAQRLMRYIGRLHPETSGCNFEGGSASRADDHGNVRVWRINFWDKERDND